MKKNHDFELSESALATDEFAQWAQGNGATLRRGDRYEVRPCKRVRGFMLRLPGIGWKLWFRTVAEALAFARRAAAIHAADCFLYDAPDQPDQQIA